MLPKKLNNKLEERLKNESLRALSAQNDLIDFSSNDYLGLSKSHLVFKHAKRILSEHKLEVNGSTGSRLLSGNHQLYQVVEKQLCEFHDSEGALIYNSGYDANLGFFSAVPQRNDIILYDELIHASIRDGLKLTLAKNYKFKHNDLHDLENKLSLYQTSKDFRKEGQEISMYIVTESVFSMDGDSPDLQALVEISKNYEAYLVVDEAHAIGVVGPQGQGLVNQLNLQKEIFARIVTFGKALGCHGAAILGCQQLMDFLVNFSRPLIYTTALPPHSLAAIKAGYDALIRENVSENSTKQQLQSNIRFFKKELKRLHLDREFIESQSAIQCCLITGNTHVKEISGKLKEKGFDVKAILSPTVPEHKERLRFCLHAYNTQEDISEVLTLLSTFVNKYQKHQDLDGRPL